MAHNPYWDILSVKHRHQVKRLCARLYAIPNFSGIAIGIVVKSGNAAVLSSKPKVTIEAINSGFSRSEILLNFAYLKMPRFISPKEFEDKDQAQKALKTILHKHQVYRGYCFSRACEDCHMIVALNTKTPITNHKALYEQTKDSIIPFAGAFIDDMLEAYLAALPELRHSRFATDQAYRHRVLASEMPIVNPESLTEKELAILYWAARGKSSADTATILSLSKNTIDSYRRDIIDKLHVTNITQAVHLAIQASLIV